MTPQLNRRRLLTASGGVAAFLSLNGSLIGPMAVAAQDSTNLEFWTIGLKGPFTEWVEGIISDFEQANPDVKITWVDVPGSSVAEKYLAAVAAGQAPDVANMYQLPRFVEMGAVLDATPYIPEDQKADFFQSFWDALTFDGKIYGIPWYANSQTFVYSKSIYREAGLDPEKPATTWNELFDHGAIIQEKTGKYGAGMALTDGSQFVDFLQIEGVSLVSEDRTTAALNTPEAAAVVQRLVDAYNAGGIPPEAITAASDDAVGWFLSGRAASFPGGAWVLNRTTPEVIEQMEFAVAPGLVGTPGKYGAGFQFLSMAADTSSPEKAVAFALHVASGKYQLSLAKQVAVLPSNQSGMNDPFWSAEPENLGQQATLMSAQQLDNSIVLYSSAPPVVEWSRMVDVVAQKIGDLFGGGLSAQDFLAQTESEWNALLSES